MNKALNNKYEQSGKFNTALFNQDFKILEEKQIKQAQIIEDNKLEEINNYYVNYKIGNNNDDNNKNNNITNYTFNELIYEWFDTILKIFSEVLKFNYDFKGFIDIFIKDNRAFYVGLTLITISVLFYLINNFTDPQNSDIDNATIINNNYINSDNLGKSNLNNEEIEQIRELISLPTKQLLPSKEILPSKDSIPLTESVGGSDKNVFNNINLFDNKNIFKSGLIFAEMDN